MTWCSRMRVGRIIPRLSSPMVKYHEEYTLRAQVGAKRSLEYSLINLKTAICSCIVLYLWYIGLLRSFDPTFSVLMVV